MNASFNELIQILQITLDAQTHQSLSINSEIAEILLQNSKDQVLFQVLFELQNLAEEAVEEPNWEIFNLDLIFLRYDYIKYLVFHILRLDSLMQILCNTIFFCCRDDYTWNQHRMFLLPRIVDLEDEQIATGEHDIWQFRDHGDILPEFQIRS